MTDGNGAAEKQYEIELYHAPFAPMPSSIVKAILHVQKQIKRVEKADENLFAKYKFTSVDSIYEAIGVAMAEAGLMILPVELLPTKVVRIETEKGVKNWGHFNIGFILATETDTWSDPRSSETLFIQIEGPQTFNGAKSYTQKTYLRALFKIPTGEADLDTVKPDSHESEPPAQAKPKKEKLPKLSAEASGAQARVIEGAIEKLSKPITPEEKDGFLESYGAIIDTLVKADADAVRNAYKERARA